MLNIIFAMIALLVSGTPYNGISACTMGNLLQNIANIVIQGYYAELKLVSIGRHDNRRIT